MQTDKLKDNEREKKWLVPPGLTPFFRKFNKVCEIFLGPLRQKGQPILVCGPTGVGKSLFVDYFIGKFTEYNKKKSLPVVRVNCAAISEGLVASELFGHKKGAFTGALRDKKGAFDLARDGILVLEEIGEMPKDVQAKLLIVLENREFYQVGGTEPSQSNALVIATTNREPKDFRVDLWHRFHAFPVPPIHQRRVDILYYFNWFLGEEMMLMLNKADVLHLLTYHWPGNVREIEQINHHLMINKLQYQNLFEEAVNVEIEKDERVRFVTEVMDINSRSLFHTDLTKFQYKKVLDFINKLNTNGLDVNCFNSFFSDFFFNLDTDDPAFPLMDYEDILPDIEEIRFSVENIKNLQYSTFRFMIAKSSLFNRVFIGFCIFSFMFFQDFKANYDLLDLFEFKLNNKWNPEGILKKLGKKANAETLSFEVLKALAKGAEFGKRKKLPLSVDEREEVVKKIFFDYTPNNNFLKMLFGDTGTEKKIQNSYFSLLDNEIMKHTEEEWKKFYYERLFEIYHGHGKSIAKHSGKSESKITNIRKKFTQNQNKNK